MTPACYDQHKKDNYYNYYFSKQMPARASTRLGKAKFQGCARFVLAWIKLHANFSFGLSNPMSPATDLDRKALGQHLSERTIPQHGLPCAERENICNFEILFLPQLPVELRLLIYDYVFYSQPASLFFNEMSFTPSSGLNLRTCFRLSQAQRRGWDVLRTCRQTYWEGLDVAIKSCSFQLKGPSCHDKIFSLSLRPQLIGQIRNLEIDWLYCATSHDPNSKFYYITDTERNTWEHLWTVVALTTSLTHLAIRIIYDGPRENMDANASWLTPLRHIRGVKNFEAHIWHAKSSRELRWERTQPF